MKKEPTGAQKLAKRHPAAKKCCGWEKPAICGTLLHKDYWNIFILSQKWVPRVSQGGSIIKKDDFQGVPN